MIRHDQHSILDYVGERLMSARVQCGLSLEGAARAAGIGDDRLAAAEAGALALEEDELAALADAYGQDVVWFFGGETTPAQYLFGVTC